ncbi:MAG: PAS domain S-box protein [Anaerolineales bacterium]|nr:PAS domain S-box protein [Anaerolineales bacterium]
MTGSTGKSTGKPPTSLENLSWPARLGLMVVVVGLYAGFFWLFHPIAGGTLGSLSMLVAALVALLGGRRLWALLGGAILFPINYWLYTATGIPESLVNHLAASIVGVGLGLVTLAAAGWFRTIRRQRQELIDERSRLDAEIIRREFVESSLQAERDFARLVIDSLGQGLVLMNSQLRFEYVNPAYAALVGRRPEEIIGKTPFDFSDPADHARIKESLDRRVRGEAHTYEMRLQHQDGHFVDALITVTPRRIEGDVAGSIVVVTDVSRQKQIEAELRQSQTAIERQARILEQTQAAARVGGWEFDLRRGKMYWTHEMYQLHDVSPDTFEVTPEMAVSIYAPEYQDQVSAAVSRAFTTGEPYDLETVVITHGGKRRWVRTVGRPVFEDGIPTVLYGSFQDITEQKRAEEQIRRAEAEYRSLYENVPIGLYRSTPGGDQARINPYLVRLNGFKTEAEQIQAIKDIGQEWYVDPERRAQFIAAIERDGEVNNFESEIRRYTTGEHLWISENARAIRDAEGNIVQYEGSVIDITTRKRVELALEDQRRFATNVMDAMGQGLTVTDKAGRFVYANPACARILGCTLDQILGRSPLDFIVDADHPKFRHSMEARARGEPTSYEATLRRGDGSLVAVLITGAQRFEGGQPTGSIATLTDLTERRKHEEALQALNSELASKNREMETFTYSVSHDLKAPLRGIDGYSRLLLEDYGDRLDGEGKRFLQTIRSATEQMNQLITDLLAYSRLDRRALAETPIDLRELVGAIVAQRLHDVRGIEPDVRVDVPHLMARGDRDGLAQAVRNLVDNAFKFTRAMPAPAITVRAERIGDVARLSVTDNGIGFDMQYHEKIFGIFTRLHRPEDYPGTGVGLALVRKAMERMGGRAWAESELGQGATFFLELPMLTDTAPAETPRIETQ